MIGLEVGNYYGNLCIKQVKDKFFWSVESWDGHHWSEIPERLYKELERFANE